MPTVDEYGYLRCDHEDGQELRVFTASNGARQFRLQCLTCGGQVGKTIQKAEIWSTYKVPPDKVPDWDRELIDSWYEQRAAQANARFEAKQQQWSLEQQQRQAQREAYMMSAKWRAIREKALRRDGHLCQGCLERRADVVHHTTYERLGDELLIDLVSLCHRCHDRAHGKERSADVSQFIANIR